MTPQDEKELHRLADMLREIDDQLQRESPLREGIKKAGLALSVAFIHGFRPEVENFYKQLDSPLTDAQRARLASFGITPDE